MPPSRPVLLVLLVGVALACRPPAAAQAPPAPVAPILVADVPVTPPVAASSMPGQFVRLADAAYFFADDGQHGRELWRSDGTAAGTTLVADLCPGSCSFRGTLDVVGARLFTLGNEGSSLALFVSDGTAAGTRLVRRFPTLSPIVPVAPVVFAERLWFVLAQSGISVHPQLWESDGTPAGTRAHGCGDGCDLDWQLLRTAGDSLYLLAGGPHSESLWRARVSAVGDVELQDLCTTTPCVGVLGYQSAVAGGRLYVVAAAAPDQSITVWSIGDGEDGPRPVAVPFGVDCLDPQQPTVVGDAVYWSCRTSANEGRRSWLRTTGSGFILASDVMPYADRETPFLIPDGERAFFIVTQYPYPHQELWVSGPGDPASRRLLAGIDSAVFAGSLGGEALFFVRQGDQNQLWATDGTPGGTHRLGDLDVLFPLPVPRLSLGGSLLLTLGDDVEGYEPWVTDGTLAGTHRLADLNPGNSSNPDAPVAFGADLFFQAGSVLSRELWRAAGTPPMATATGIGRVGDLVAAGRHLFFTPDGARGLLALDATGSLQPVRDGLAYNVTPWGDRAVFGAPTSPATGQGLWVTDGSAAGTTLVSDVFPDYSTACQVLCPGNWPRYPLGMTAVGDVLFWVGLPPPSGVGEQVYRTAGTAESTQALLPAPQPGRYRTVDSLAPFRHGLALVTREEAAGATTTSTLWVTGGTADTTRALLSTGDTLWMLGTAGDRALFARRTVASVDELWATDGTPAGTQLLSGLGDGEPRITTGSSGPALRPYPVLERSALAGDRLFFAALDEQAGEELWVSDGTAAGTRRVADIRPGAEGSHPQSLTAYRACAVFAASGATDGQELWASDGASAWLVSDVAPGAAASSPGPAAAAGGYLAFAANDGEHGRELFAVPTATLDARCAGLPADPPPGSTWLTSARLPGYRLQVRLGSGAGARAGALAPCASAALCVTATPGDRRELLLRVAPAAGGGAALAVAKLGLDAAEVWIEQTATGTRRYVHLDATPSGGTMLAGWSDVQAFPAAHALSLTGGATADGAAAPAEEARDATERAGLARWWSPRGIPGFRFQVRWRDAAGVAHAARAEACMPGALCASGPVRGRADVFVRLLDQGAAGRWPAIARLERLGFEVVVQAIRSGETRTYALPVVPASVHGIDGLLDPRGFAAGRAGLASR